MYLALEAVVKDGKFDRVMGVRSYGPQYGFGEKWLSFETYELHLQQMIDIKWIGKPEFLGKIPIRTDVEVLPADPGTRPDSEVFKSITDALDEGRLPPLWDGGSLRRDIEVKVIDNTGAVPCCDGPWDQCACGQRIWCRAHGKNNCQFCGGLP